MADTYGISPFGLNFIKQQEGWAPKAAWDYKQNTNGWGTRANYAGEPIDKDEADRRLLAETGRVSDFINSNVTSPMNQSQRDALHDIGFNLGTGKGGLSDFIPAINAGDWNSVASALPRYNHAGGAVNDALTRRRAQEISMILNGSPDQGQSMTPFAAGGFGAPANFNPDDPLSAMYAPPPAQGAAPVGGGVPSGGPVAAGGAPAGVTLPTPPNMRYSRLADALLGSAAGAQPTGWGSLLNALGDAGLGYSLANKADTQQTDYRSALAKALQGATGQDQLVNTMIASQDPELQKAAITAKMAPKVQIDRFKVDPNGGIFDSATGQYVTGGGGSAAPMTDANGQPLSPLANKKAQEKIGEGIGDARNALPNAKNSGRTIISNIDDLLKDPGLSSVTGPVQGQLPSAIGAPVAWWNGDTARVQGKVDQLKGETFMQAFNGLKGGGQITEVEGAKATAALNKLQNTKMNDPDYYDALVEFRDEVGKLYDLAQEKAGVPPAQREKLPELDQQLRNRVTTSSRSAPEVGAPQPSQGAAPQPSPTAAPIPDKALQMLKADQSAQSKQHFDEIFGQGAADRALGGSAQPQQGQPPAGPSPFNRMASPLWATSTDVATLKANPTPERIRQYNAVFGEGAAEKVLNAGADAANSFVGGQGAYP